MINSAAGGNMDEIAGGQPRLTAALRALAEEDAASGTSAVVQAQLMEEVRRLRHARRRSFVKMFLLSAILCAATATPFWYVTTADRRIRSSSASQNVPTHGVGEMATAFFPLMYSTVPVSGGRLVRLEVPQQRAAAFGVEIAEVAGDSAASVVLADVLVGDDGVARAVRFVRPLTRPVSKERQQ